MKLKSILRTRRIDNNEIQKSEEKKSTLRSSNPPFSFITDCIFCGNTMPIIPDETVSKVETVSLKDSLLIHCENRQDSWTLVNP